MSVYWHGGTPGIPMGHRLMSPFETGVRSAKSYVPEGEPFDTSHVREDRVYLTSRYETAVMFAAMYPVGGTIYTALPIGHVEDDPDWKGEPGESVMCKAAVVLRAEPLDAATVRKVREALMP